MDEYNKEKWSADFPDRAGQEVRPTEAVENSLDYDVCFPQYLAKTQLYLTSKIGQSRSSSVMMRAFMNASRRRQQILMPI